MSTLKFIAITILSVVFANVVNAQGGFVLTGKLSGKPDTKVLIHYQDSQNKPASDSCWLSSAQTIALKGDISIPTRALLVTKADGKLNSTNIYLEPAKKITINGEADDLKNIDVKGSATHNEYRTLEAELDVVNKDFDATSKRTNLVRDELDALKKAGRQDKVIDSVSVILDSLKKLREPFAARYEAIIKNFVKVHHGSYLGPPYMITYISSWPLNEVTEIFDNFSPGVQSSPVGLRIKNEITKRRADLTAKPGFNFTGIDLEGKKISLANFKGKYVLLDFWGSWCIPCREGTPHLKQAFDKYHNAGLEIIAIACNDKPEDWKRAIKKDGTNIWHHIRQEEKHGTTEINDEYNVHIFPTKILIDKSGTVIARFSGSGEDAAMDKKLVEVFGNK